MLKTILLLSTLAAEPVSGNFLRPKFKKFNFSNSTVTSASDSPPGPTSFLQLTVKDNSNSNSLNVNVGTKGLFVSFLLYMLLPGVFGIYGSFFVGYAAAMVHSLWPQIQMACQVMGFFGKVLINVFKMLGWGVGIPIKVVRGLVSLSGKNTSSSNNLVSEKLNRVLLTDHQITQLKTSSENFESKLREVEQKASGSNTVTAVVEILATDRLIAILDKLKKENQQASVDAEWEKLGVFTTDTKLKLWLESSDIKGGKGISKKYYISRVIDTV